MEKGLCCGDVRHGVEGKSRMDENIKRVKVCTIYADVIGGDSVDIRWSLDFLKGKELFISDVMKDVACELGTCYSQSPQRFSEFLKALIDGKKQKLKGPTLW